MSSYIADVEISSVTSREIIDLAVMPVCFELGPENLVGLSYKDSFSKSVQFSADKWSPECVATHGVLPEDREGLPKFTDAAVQELMPDIQYVIGHGVDFDCDLLKLPEEVRRIDTLAMSKVCYPNLESFKLGMVYLEVMGMNRASIAVLKGSHSAETDVVMAFWIARDIAMQNGIHDMLGLWEFSEHCRMPTKMPFGKHKDVLIAELPVDYLRWALGDGGLTEIDKYLRAALQKSLDARSGRTLFS